MENENKSNTQENKEAPLSIVEEAKKIRDEIKAENDRREQILVQEQKLQAEKLLGSSAGQPPQVIEPKEETPKEYADRVMRGDIKVK